ARSRSEVSEAVLAGLAGKPFTAAARAASEMADDMARWTTPVTSDRAARLTVRLAPPEDDGGWLLTVESNEPSPDGGGGTPLPAEEVLHSGRRARAAAVETELRRLERLLPALRRPGRRRGRVVMDGTEAWELMTVGGAVLEAAGFTVRVPLLAKKRSSPRLQLHAEALGGESVVGAQQLSRVQWSVAVDDVTLDAAAIRKLAAQARPLVQTKGGWVELLDRAGLGGCLAMDMGLGKTPTVLAHMLEHTGDGPALVIAPPAVLGNWAAEAARFTPGLRVRMHHGADRASGEEVAAE